MKRHDWLSYRTCRRLDFGARPVPGPSDPSTFPELPIVVGRWGDGESSAGPAEQLTAAGASRVVFSLADARTAILSLVLSQRQKDPVGAALPS